MNIKGIDIIETSLNLTNVSGFIKIKVFELKEYEFSFFTSYINEIRIERHPKQQNLYFRVTGILLLL